MAVWLIRAGAHDPDARLQGLEKLFASNHFPASSSLARSGCWLVEGHAPRIVGVGHTRCKPVLPLGGRSRLFEIQF